MPLNPDILKMSALDKGLISFVRLDAKAGEHASVAFLTVLVCIVTYNAPPWALHDAKPTASTRSG